MLRTLKHSCGHVALYSVLRHLWAGPSSEHGWVWWCVRHCSFYMHYALCWLFLGMVVFHGQAVFLCSAWGVADKITLSILFYLPYPLPTSLPTTTHVPLPTSVYLWVRWDGWLGWLVVFILALPLFLFPKQCVFIGVGRASPSSPSYKCLVSSSQTLLLRSLHFTIPSPILPSSSVSLTRRWHGW